ncbi:hypothetical protein [Gloeocapsopsis crepidinum]|uniref:hypothetical protein n=1 Tax=Gloeocapsopsis crepidinum TaxID=693223 RepID=UPI0030D86808
MNNKATLIAFLGMAKSNSLIAFMQLYPTVMLSQCRVSVDRSELPIIGSDRTIPLSVNLLFMIYSLLQN